MDNENIKRIYKKIKVEQITICWSEVFIKRNGNSISNFCFIDLSKNYLTEEVKKEKNILIMLYNALKAKLLKDNSVFADSNKRIAATLFIYFLNLYGILYKNRKQTIDSNTLVALTLLIAEFNPKEQDVIIDLVMNFLNND